MTLYLRIFMHSAHNSYLYVLKNRMLAPTLALLRQGALGGKWCVKRVISIDSFRSWSGASERFVRHIQYCRLILMRFEQLPVCQAGFVFASHVPFIQRYLLENKYTNKVETRCIISLYIKRLLCRAFMYTHRMLGFLNY